jgi:caffeoyl-CoA O-methyltransferase
MHPDWQTDLLQYCEANSSPEPAFLQDLVRYTWLHTVNPRQLSGHLQGRFLALIASIRKPNCILEIGTFTGYSALCLAEGLAENGVLHTLEADPELAFKATNWLQTTPFANCIQVHSGNALDLIPTLGVTPELIFVDAEKQQYQAYAELCLPLLAPNGLMLFDNTLWSMKVLDETLRSEDADTAAMHAFNAYLRGVENIDLVMLPIRDGLTVVRKK